MAFHLLWKFYLIWTLQVFFTETGELCSVCLNIKKPGVGKDSLSISEQ